MRDQLVLEAPEGATDEACAGLEERMSDAAKLRVPLKVETGVGANWDEAH